jgi:hypothetical protein
MMHGRPEVSNFNVSFWAAIQLVGTDLICDQPEMEKIGLAPSVVDSYGIDILPDNL